MTRGTSARGVILAFQWKRSMRSRGGCAPPRRVGMTKKREGGREQDGTGRATIGGLCPQRSPLLMDRTLQHKDKGGEVCARASVGAYVGAVVAHRPSLSLPHSCLRCHADLHAPMSMRACFSHQRVRFILLSFSPYHLLFVFFLCVCALLPFPFFLLFMLTASQQCRGNTLRWC